MAITFSEKPYAKELLLCHPELLYMGGNTDFVKAEGSPYTVYYMIDKSLFPGVTNIEINYYGAIHNYPITTWPLPPDEYGISWSPNAVDFADSFNANADLHSKYIIEITYEDAYFIVVKIISRSETVDGSISITDDAGALTMVGYYPGSTLNLVNEITTICDIYDATDTINTNYLGSLSSGHYYNKYEPDRQFKFNISEFIHRCLAPETLEWSINTDVVKCEKSIKRFQLYFKTSMPDIYPGGVILQNIKVLRGGITKRDYIRYSKSYFGTYPDDSLWKLKNFVTNASNIFYTATKKQKLYSSFATLFDFTETTYKMFLNMIDINSISASAALAQFELAPLNKYSVNWGYIETDIEALASSNALGPLKSFWLTLLNMDTMEEYIIDFRNLVEQSPKDLFFVFENSIGGWQTITTYGENSFSIDVTKAEYPIENNYLVNAEDSYLIGETISHRQYREAFTGWIDGIDKHCLLDFLNSENVYVQDDRHEAMRPVKILGDEYVIEERNNNGIYQYGYTFKYMEAVTNKHISDLITL